VPGWWRALGLAAFCGACAACASPGSLPAPGPPPGPTVGQPGMSPGFSGLSHGVRALRYTDAIKQISLRGHRLGWGGVEVGMTHHQAELAVGQRLPALSVAEADPLCGFAVVVAEVLRQPLRLEFDLESGEGRLKAIWLPLFDPHDPNGVPSVDATVRALKTRFPKLVYLPSPNEPQVAESVSSRPAYSLAEGGTFLVDPRQGVFFGEICVN
jgi:hypothetical protein